MPAKTTRRPTETCKAFVEFVRQWYATEEYIPLHEPRFAGNERTYVDEAITSTFVSSVGEFVDRFERMAAEYTGAQYAVATVNGTAALHVALLLAGVKPGDEVVTQPLSFVATCNAIKYCGAQPVFVDIDRATLGLSPDSLTRFLERFAERRDNQCVNRVTGHNLTACLPVHAFGHPVKIDTIKDVCDHYNVVLVEDAAEALGSFYKDTHVGITGRLGILSFNGNKIITTGAGGMILTDDEDLAHRAKHLTTTAKVPHPWRYTHDKVGFNYRMPNVNAALGCGQMESIDKFLEEKRALAVAYNGWCDEHDVEFVHEPSHSRSNYWLNAILLEDDEARDQFIQQTNNHRVMTRPAWDPLYQLPMYRSCLCDEAANTRDVANRLVNIPSSARLIA